MDLGQQAECSGGGGALSLPPSRECGRPSSVRLRCLGKRRRRKGGEWRGASLAEQFVRCAMSASKRKDSNPSKNNSPTVIQPHVAQGAAQQGAAAATATAKRQAKVQPHLQVANLQLQ